MLEAAVRHFRHKRNMSINPDCPEVETLGQAHRSSVVVGPDASRESVLHAVGPAYGLVFVTKSLNSDDWPDHLVLHHLVVLPQPADNRRAEEVAARSDALATGKHFGVVRRAVQESLHPGELIRVVYRAEGCVGYFQSADLCSLG